MTLQSSTYPKESGETDKELTLVIPAKDINDPKLAELLRSIDAQDFPKEKLEVLVITEGTSESAKAIGIRRARGKVIGILASDNELIGNNFISYIIGKFNDPRLKSAWTSYYYYEVKDNILNRYFSLMGGNDVLSFYMGKNDRLSFLKSYNYHFKKGKFNKNLSIGDNGFFIRKDLIDKTDLDNYYHVDNALEATNEGTALRTMIWHKTGGNIIEFFKKRYRYGMQYAFDSKRRWHLVDFHQPKDILRLLWFIFATLTIIQPLCLSIRGYLKVRDVAWFLNWPMMGLTLAIYALLVVNLGIKRLFQWLSAPMAAQRA